MLSPSSERPDLRAATKGTKGAETEQGMATKKTSNTEIDQGIFNRGWDQDKCEEAVWKFNPDRIRAIGG